MKTNSSDDKTISATSAVVIVIGLALALLAMPSILLAQPGGGPPGKGHGKANATQRSEPSVVIDIDFGVGDRRLIRDYFGGVARSGHCPPGLAKKHNGCLPPGIAKKWRIGRPLPPDVIFHDLPRDLAVRIKLPPEGYRIVRVASDILMIAVGTGIVAAAIEDIAQI